MKDEDIGVSEVSLPQSSEPDFLTHVSSEYCKATKFRAAVQLILGIGGALDTIFAGRGSKWQMERLIAFIQDLDNRLRVLEASGTTIPNIAPSEPLYDFIMMVLEQVVRTRSIEKREHLSAIVTRQVADPQPWDDAEAAATLTSQLTEFDVEVLKAIASSTVNEERLKGAGFATTASYRRDGGSTLLQDMFPGVPYRAIRLSLSTLVARSLILDVSLTAIAANEPDHFMLTELGEWFLGWLAQPVDLVNKPDDQA